MKLTANFVVQEFVSPEAYKIHGDALVNALNPQLAPTAQRIKDATSEKFGEEIFVVCNDWLWNMVPHYTKSGLRDASMAEDFKAKYSWHFYGCAMDLKFIRKGLKIIPHKNVYDMIMESHDKFPYITRLENPDKTPTWLHVEVCNKPRTGDIEVFNP